MRAGPVGVFDSGLGGLSVLKALRAEMPQRNFIYIADSAYAPYGERDAGFVLARSRSLSAYLIDQGVQALVIACNTATAAAIDSLRADYPAWPVVGVEPALKPAAAQSRTKRVGVMATRGTLTSLRFRQLLDTLSTQATFVLQACDGLAEAIERSASGPGPTPELIAACARHTRAMGPFGLNTGEIDTLVLGCTHYPFASTTLRSLLGPDVTLVDTGAPVARQTRTRLQAAGLLAEAASQAAGEVRLCSTGPAVALQAAARRWLQLDAKVETLSI